MYVHLGDIRMLHKFMMRYCIPEAGMHLVCVAMTCTIYNVPTDLYHQQLQV